MQKIEEYLLTKKEWNTELTLIRKVLNDSELIEDYKWGVPVYTLNGKNVVGVAAWKNYAGLWFFNGVFLKDEHKLLINAQEDKTKGLRQLRFTSVDEINVDILKQYIEEAIQNQKDRLELKATRTKQKDVILLSDFLALFDNIEDLKSAIYNLPSGKQ